MTEITREKTLAWAVGKWNDEVRLRPLVNVHRRTLDDTWRQIIKYLGGDDVGLCGPPHDELLALKALDQPAPQKETPNRDGPGYRGWPYDNEDTVPEEPAPVASEEMVEKVARVIDPRAWEIMDGYIEQQKRKYKGQNVGWPVDQFQHKESMEIARRAIAAMKE